MEENVCRICLQASDEEEMSSIYQNDEQGTQIANKIKSCCGVKLPQEDDGFPTKICSKCKVFLTIAYKLRTICKNSDAYLRRFKANVKDSEVEENDEIQLKEEVEDEATNFKEAYDEKPFPQSDEELPNIKTFSDVDSKSDKSEIEPTSSTRRSTRQKKTQNPKAEKRPSKEQLTCQECGKILYSKVLLNNHLERHKTGFAAKKPCKLSICPYCGDCFPQTSLSIHIRRHTGEKPYKCDVCGKAFVRNLDLALHIRTHTGEKPYVCATCGKAFSRQNKLRRHTRVHTGERPYKCNQCDRAFAQRNDLNLHIRRHTGEKPYVCKICGQGFLNGTFLKNHQKSASHFVEEDSPDPFIKIRVSNPTRSHRNPVSKRLLSDPIDQKQS